MSGLEAIGAIASISQLAQYTATLILNLRALYHNIKQSGERCELYQKQIEQLIQVADLIISLEKVLQSDAIATHVRALLRTTETIEEALRHGYVGGDSRILKRCLRAWKWSKAEESILKGFADLERDQNCLTLCILATYGRLISRIDKNIETGIPQIQDQVGKIERSLSNCSTIVKEGDRIKADSTVLDKHICSHRISLKMHKSDENNKELVIRAAQALQTKSQAPSCNEPFQAMSMDGSCSDSLSESGLNVQPRRDSANGSFLESTLADESPPSDRAWSGNVASEGAMQINGNVGKKDAVDAALVNCRWSQNEARDQSRQVNGEILDAKFAAIFFCQAQTTSA